MSVTGSHDWLDPLSVACSRCMAQPGEPCVTIRETFGSRYRGRGEPCDYVHAARGEAALAARKARA